MAVRKGSLIPIGTALLVAAAAMIPSSPASAADLKVSGKIKTYDCGDNCYLTIATEGDNELTGLCVADACSDWNANLAMPPKFVGKRVQVTTGTGQRVNGNGDVMDDFPAFTEIVFIDR